MLLPAASSCDTVEEKASQGNEIGLSHEDSMSKSAVFATSIQGLIMQGKTGEQVGFLHCPSSPIASPNFLYATYQLIQVLIVGSNGQFA
jgi:hypothetical protein